MRFEVAYRKGLIQLSVPGVIERTGRWFECFICGERTPWHRPFQDCPSVPCCSDECLDAWEELENSNRTVG